MCLLRHTNTLPDTFTHRPHKTGVPNCLFNKFVNASPYTHKAARRTFAIRSRVVNDRGGFVRMYMCMRALLGGYVIGKVVIIDILAAPPNMLCMPSEHM